MSDSTVLSHFHKKQSWMASHIEQAQFPTKESKAGLALYKAAEKQPELVSNSHPDSDTDGYTFYRVDCHPLMVRYAMTLAQKWPESERETLMEYLSQVSLTDIPTPDGIHVELVVAMQEGNPKAAGMLFSSEEEQGTVTGIYDVFGIAPDAQQAMKSHLLVSAHNALIVCE